MNGVSQEIERQYLSGLVRYLEGGGEAALQSAYEAGRRAIGGGLGALEMLAIHQKCLAALLGNVPTPEECASVVYQAGSFFSESLSPFEMGLRGFREANATLTKNLADLGAAKEQLHRQHNQLLAAHQAIEAERRRYRDLFDFAPDGYLVTDLKGGIEEANRAAGELLAVPYDSLPGTSLIQWIAEEQRAPFAARVERLPEDDTEKAQDWQYDIRRNTATLFPATISVRVVRDSSGAPVSLRWLLRDATERRRMEEERAQMLVREQVARAQSEAAQRFAFLADISRMLATSLDCEATLGDVARCIVPYLADHCLVYLAEPDGRIRLVCTAPAESGQTDQPTRLWHWNVAVPPEPELARLLRAGRAEILPHGGNGWGEWINVESDARLDTEAQSLLIAPMQTHGRLVGLLVLASAQPNQYRHEHLALAEDLARRCALAVENAELYSAMAAERDKAEEANRAKDEFLAILGHELRNPLVPILGWARNLKKADGVSRNSTLSQGVQTIERNALNMLRLADECLDLARISERKINLDKEVVDLNQLLRGSIGALSHTAEEKGLRVDANLSEPRLHVFGDRMRLEQVLNNLLINAIKYTRPGGVISIRTSVIRDEGLVEVEDTGIGIAPEFLEQIFQPFRRGSNEWLASDAGLGLGLAIARKIVEMHGGTIWAESPGLNRGSTLRVRMPLASSEAQCPIPVSPAHAEAGRREALRILLIDDHKDVTELTKMDLESLGYQVRAAADGHEGLEIARRELPDVVVSDVKMPRMDGYELVQKLRQIPELATVPIIALTGFGMKKDVQAALAAGYDAHINKPADVDRLSDLIQRLAAQRRTLRSGA